MTSTERMRAKRERDREAVWTDGRIGDLSNTGLMVELAYAFHKRDEGRARVVAEALLREVERRLTAR